MGIGTLELRRSKSGRGYITHYWPNATDKPQSEGFEEKEQLLAYVRKFKIRRFSPEDAVKQLEVGEKFRVTVEN